MSGGTPRASTEASKGPAARRTGGCRRKGREFFYSRRPPRRAGCDPSSSSHAAAGTRGNPSGLGRRGRPAPIRLCRAGGRSSFDRSPDCDRRDGPAELWLPRPPSSLVTRQRKRQKPPALALDTRSKFSRVGRPVISRHRGAHVLQERFPSPRTPSGPAWATPADLTPHREPSPESRSPRLPDSFWPPFTLGFLPRQPGLSEKETRRVHPCRGGVGRRGAMASGKRPH